MANSNPFLESPLEDITAELTPIAPPAKQKPSTPAAPAATSRGSAPTNDDLVRRATELGVDPKLALSFFSQESSGNWNSPDSPRKARGGMQVMPDTYKMMMGTAAGQNDPWQNMEAGLRYIRYGQDKLGTRDVRLLAAGYHAGYDHPALRKGQIPDANDGMISTRDYAESVFARYNGGKPPKASAVTAKTSILADGLMPITDAKELEKFSPNTFSDLVPLSTEETASLQGNAFTDVGRNLKIGINTAAQDVREVVGKIPLVGDSIVKGLDSVDEYFSGKPSDKLLAEDSEKMRKSLTPDMQAALEKKWWDSEKNTFGPAWTDWRSYTGGVTQSLPEQALTMLPALRLAKAVYAARIAGGATEVVASQAAARAAQLAGTFGEGLLGGASSSRAVRDEIMKLPQDVLNTSDAYRTLIASGLTHKDAQRALADDAASRAFVTAGVTTGIFGGMGDRAIAKIVVEKAGGSAAKYVAGNVVKGAVSEGLFEELPQSAFQQLAQNEAIKTKANPNKALSDDVLNQALGGLALGGAQGGGTAALASGSRRPEDAGATQNTPPNTPPAADLTPADPVAPIAPVPNAPSEARGPLERATENAAANPERVTVTAPEGQVSGTVTGKAADGTTQIVGDDGQVYNFKVGENGVTITPDAPNTPLSNALEVAADETSKQNNASAVAQNEAFSANQPAVGDVPAAPEAAAPAADAAVEPATSEPATSKPAAQAPDIKPVQTQTDPLDLTTMDEPALRARLKYIADQAKTNGDWNKMLVGERRRVKSEINKRQAAAPQNTAPVSAQVPVTTDQTQPVIDAKSSQTVALPKELAGAKPRYNYGNKAFELNFESDIDRAAFIAAQDTPSKRDADYLNFVMQATGMSEAEARAHGKSVRSAIKGMATWSKPGTLKVPALSWRSENDGNGQVSDSIQGGGTAAQPSSVPGEAPALPAGGREPGPANDDRNAGADQQPATLKTTSKPVDQLADDEWAGVIGAIEGPARADGPNEKISAEDAAMLRKMVVKAIKDGVKAGKTSEQIVAQIEGLTKGGIGNTGMNRINALLDAQSASNKPTKASKEDLDRLFGVDTKRAKALERIAAGKAWFNDGVKAKDFIAKNGLKDTHEVVKGKGGRFEIQAKGQTDGNDNRAAGQRNGAEAMEQAAGQGSAPATVQSDAAQEAGQAEVDAPLPSAAAPEQAATEPENWRNNTIKARAYAKSLGINTKGMDLEEIARAIDAKKGAQTVEPEAQQIETTPPPAEKMMEPDWWTALTPNERYRRLQASGIRGTAETPWNRLNAADQRALDEQWGGQQDELDAEMRSYEAKAEAAQANKGVAPGTRVNGDADRAAADRLEKLYEQMDNITNRNSREGNAKAAVRSVIEELRKPKTVTSVEAVLEKASSDLARNYGAFADVIDQVVESLAAPASPAVSPLTQARNDLIDINTRIEQQGNVVDDRLLERKRQQEKLVKELEAEQAKPAMSPQEAAQSEFSSLEKSLQSKSRAEMRDGDVAIATGGGKVRYVSFDDALAAARQAVESGVKPVPFQIHNATGITIGDADRVIATLNDQGAKQVKPVVSENKVFTEDAAAKARALLKKKLSGSQLNSGVDPEVLQAGITLAGYHIEKGARTFAAYAQAMVADLGDVVKPYLKSWYMGVKYDPRAAGFDGMDAAADVEAADVDAMTAAPAMEDENEPEALDEPGARALEGTPADLLSGLEPDGQAGRGAEGSGRENAPRDERARGGRVQQSGGMGDGARDVPVSTGRTRKGRGGQQGGGAVQRGERTQQPDLADVGGNRELEPTAGQRAQDRSSDFVISDEDSIGEGGAKTKFRNNMAAIRLLKQLQAEDRAATRAEQAVLAKYVGWGGIPQAFERDNGEVSKGWDKEVAELKEALTPEELAAAASSTRNAHYTSPEIVQAMWSIAKRFGFQGGRVLEPSVGVGNFFGLMPTDLRAASQMTGVELDRITGGIAQKLYPQANIAAPVGFQDFSAPDNYFDLAIGNPPFGREGIYDATRRKISGFSIHNYFFAKSIDTVKPNGVLAMVVTNRLLDSVGDKARQYIADRSEFLGAIRLPNDAFMANAGTAVTTDIIFLRKLAEGEQPKGDRWMDVRQYTDKNGKQVPLNEYFIRNPEMMLGDFGAYGSMYSPDDPALVAREGQDTPALMAEAINRLPQKFMDPPTAEPTRETISPARDISNVKIGSVFEQDGQVFERREDLLNQQQAAPVTFPNDKARERVLGMIRVRDALVQVRSLQLSNTAKDKDIEAARAELNKVYDAFVKANGPLNVDANKRLMRDDPSWPQIAALEDNFDKGISPAVAKSTGEKPRAPSAKKAAIFTKRTQSPYQPPQKASSAKDALVTSLSERGRVDLDYMAGLYGKTPDAIATELGDLIYKNPVAGWETREQYLSGNVKQKLAQAIEAAKADPAMNANVEALRAVQPIDIEAVDIDVKVGAQWIPADVMEDFVRAVTEAGKTKAIYNPVNAQWTITADNVPQSAQTQWSTDRVRVNAVLEAAANQKQIQVFDQNYDGTRTLNTAATTAANEKVERVKAEWKRWIWQDDARRDRLARIYNDTFNTDVSREFDGSHLTFPGKVGDDIITLRPHQANAVWRMVQSGTTLLDHVVGAGKTFTMIAGIMEMRRMGLAKKPMLVVPNHLVGQWGVDFIKLYPGANILVATKKDFEKDNRKRMFARIATGDWDAVIVAHSSFGKVEVEPEFQERFIKQQISDMDTSITAMRAAEGKGSRNVKQIEKQKAALEEKLKRLFDTGAKDDNLYFGELGVDAVFLDEAHEFKNLGFSPGMQRVAGLGNPTGSQKAADLFMKVQSVLKRTGGRNVVFATGTPISNTMAEMYTMQRYLDYDTLKAQGISHFDAWAKTFGEVVTDWELSPSGQYKMNSRFAKFVNMPELMQRYQSFGDVINRDDINRQLAEQGKKLPVPKVKGGKPENVIVPRSDDQAQYIGVPMTYDDGREVYPESSLIWRSENLPKKAEKGADNMLKIMSDARKAALDMRLIDPSYPDNPSSKVNVAADNIKSIYDQWEKDKGTQLVFIDLSTPKGAAAKEAAALQELIKAAEDGDEAAQEKLDAMSPDELLALESGKFSVYDDLKAKLIARGIPEKEIAFIHDANTEQQKEDLFGKVRSGRVRVLFGSTAKMGAGMNVQDRLVALHHLDAPWRPSDLEQREGRIIRQGNALYEADPENFEVSIKRYATKQTLDSRMWQTIEAKARFIEQVRKGAGSREVEDVAGEAANSAEMKAASSGNPLILEEMTLRQQIRKLENQQSEHDREQFRIRDRVRMLADSANRIEARAALSEQDAKKVPKKFEVKIGNQTFDKHGEAGEAILAAVDAMQKAGEDSRDIGSYGGFSLSLAEVGRMGGKNEVLLIVNGAAEYQIEANPGSNATGLGLRLQNTVKGLEEDAKSSRETAAKNRADIPKLEGQIKPWGQGDELADAKAHHAAIIEQLKPKKKDQPAAEGGETPAMSRSTGQGGQKIADTFRFASTILDGFANPPNLEVVETIDDPRVPQEVRDEAARQKKGGAKGEPEGFYLNGTVYLVNSQLKTPADVARVLFHETLGHYGLRGLYGDALTPILREIVQRRKNDVIARATAYGMDVSKNEDMLKAAEEVLAFMAQERPNIGFVQRAIAAIKTWLRKNVPGFADMQFSDGELIRDYILPARAFVERGGQAAGTEAGSASFSRSQEPADTGLTPPEQGMLRRVQAAVQDNMNRVKQVQSRIEKLTGSKMPEIENYYGAETNRPGRIAARLEDVRDKMTKPLIERLVAGGYKMPQLSELLHAQHAKERNEAIAKINPDMPDGGSGMTNAQADAVLAKYRNERELMKIAEQARQIARATLDLKLAYGLIDEETHKTLTERYDFYVPLKGDGEYGPKIKRAMGHDERDEFIIENIARDYDQAVVVGEKNLARHSLLAMTLENPDPELWTVGVAPKGRYVAGYSYRVMKDGKEVAVYSSMAQVSAFLEHFGTGGGYEVLDQAGERVKEFAKPLQANEVPVYLNGQMVRIQIKDETLVSQLRPLDQGRMNPILEGMRSMTRYLSKIYTGYNPYFIPTNLVRDLLTGTINIAGNEGAVMLARAWANYPQAFAAMGQWAATKKAPQTQAGKYLEEYRAAGGKTGAAYMSDLEQQAKTLERLFDDAYGVSGYVTEGRYGKAAMVAGRKTVGGLAHVIEIANQATENSLRLALFMAMRKQGVSVSEAARAAKTVTVDFDRRGKMTGALGAIYLFFNPAVQGTTNALRTLAKGKHRNQAWAVLAGLTMLGFYAATQGMDDDEDRWLGEGWDMRSKIFMLNVGGHTIRIPLSLEFAPFYGLGVAMGEASRGQSKVAAAGHVMTSFLNAWFPLGGVYDYDSENKLMDATQAFVPTVIKPGFEIATNRNFFGGQIVPENEFTKNKPDSLKMYRATKGTVYDSAAQNVAAIGEVLGAGKFENDLSKVSPETLKYLWRIYTGGIGQFVGDTVSVGKLKASGAELEASEIPFVKNFVRNNDVRAIRGRYYDLANEARAAITEFNQAKKAGDGAEMDKILANPDKSPLIGLGRLIKSTNEAAAAMRDEMVEINADTTLTDPQKRAKLKELEKEEEKLYRNAIEAFR